MCQLLGDSYSRPPTHTSLPPCYKILAAPLVSVLLGGSLQSPLFTSVSPLCSQTMKAILAEYSDEAGALSSSVLRRRRLALIPLPRIAPRVGRFVLFSGRVETTWSDEGRRAELMYATTGIASIKFNIH